MLCIFGPYEVINEGVYELVLPHNCLRVMESIVLSMFVSPSTNYVLIAEGLVDYVHLVLEFFELLEFSEFRFWLVLFDQFV